MTPPSLLRLVAASAGAGVVATYVLMLLLIPEETAAWFRARGAGAVLSALSFIALCASVTLVEIAMASAKRFSTRGQVAAVLLSWLPLSIVTTGYWILRCGSVLP